MAKQIKRFFNPPVIGQSAVIETMDGVEMVTSQVLHLNMHKDGTIDITTKSGSIYADFDIEQAMEAQRREEEAKMTPEQIAKREQTIARELQKTQGAAIQHLANHLNSSSEPIYAGQIQINSVQMWNGIEWKDIQPNQIQAGMSILLNVTDQNLFNHEPVNREYNTFVSYAQPVGNEINLIVAEGVLSTAANFQEEICKRCPQTPVMFEPNPEHVTQMQNMDGYDNQDYGNQEYSQDFVE